VLCTLYFGITLTLGVAKSRSQQFFCFISASRAKFAIFKRKTTLNNKMHVKLRYFKQRFGLQGVILHHCTCQTRLSAKTAKHAHSVPAFNVSNMADDKWHFATHLGACLQPLVRGSEAIVVSICVGHKFRNFL